MGARHLIRNYCGVTSTDFLWDLKILILGIFYVYLSIFSTQ